MTDKTYMVQVPSAVVADRRLSWRARGILSFLRSFDTEEGPALSSLHRHTPEGREAVATAVGELIDHGYLWRYKGQDDRGHWEHKYVIFDEPPTLLLPREVGFRTRKSPAVSGQRYSCGVCATPDITSSDAGTTYIVRRGQHIKIGTTTRLPQRLKQLGRAHPGVLVPEDFDHATELELLGMTQYPEHSLHRVWASLHVHGEWFQNDSLLADWARGLVWH